MKNINFLIETKSFLRNLWPNSWSKKSPKQNSVVHSMSRLFSISRLGAIHLLRSHRGGRGLKGVANFANDNTDRSHETANKGGGGQKYQKFCERNKWMPPYFSSFLRTPEGVRARDGGGGGSRSSAEETETAVLERPFTAAAATVSRL